MTFKQIREGKFTKVVVSYLAIQIMLQFTGSNQLFALTGGPSQPEFNSFTPIGTSDMVNLGTGDFSYNMPVMDIGGYPINLSYNSNPTMDQEATNVGLGWNLNIGQIARQVRGLPDDFKGDKVRYENDKRKNITVGTNIGLTGAIAGFELLKASVGLGVQFNNYEGITWKPSLGAGFEINENVTVGYSLSGSTADGATVTPNVKFSKKGSENSKNQVTTVTGGVGVGLNSRKGLENVSLSVSAQKVQNNYNLRLGTRDGMLAIVGKEKTGETFLGGGGVSGGVSFNDQSYTPSKAVGTFSTNFTYNAAFGAEFFLIEGKGEISGYASYQDILDKDVFTPTYGYEFTEHNEGLNGVLDFNREKEKHFNRQTTALPVTNYTYDLYSVQGQGIGGMFRPYRSQVSYLYDKKVSDIGVGASYGGEIELGNLVHGGLDIKVSPTSGHTKKWTKRNHALPWFMESVNETKPIANYETSYFRMIGEAEVDRDTDLYENQLHAEAPFKLKVGGGKYHRSLGAKKQVGASSVGISIDKKAKRKERQLRNQSVYKVSNKEAEFDEFVDQRPDNLAKDHHTVGMKILKPDGSTYVYGKSVYNTTKVEATFDVSSKTGNCQTGLVDYNGTVRGNNTGQSNKFLNRITTPSYAHTYLLSTVLSADYEDRTGNGVSPDDFGGYTKFSYKDRNSKENPYRWRVPFDVNTATFNEGMQSKKNDQTGNYIYGEKEMSYIEEIETKTHIAKFVMSPRKDALGVEKESGGKDVTSVMYQLDNIYLYSKPEYNTMIMGTNWDAVSDEIKQKTAIKVAHFKYNYSLCQDVLNNINYINDVNTTPASKGKLTLEKVWFTYRGSNMGKYTPYEFTYGQFDANGNGVFDNTPSENINKSYNIKEYDIWGNYKENTSTGCGTDGTLTTSEFPFVEQNKEKADENAVTWNLTSIKLPSGGKMEVNYESDDYGHVQDKAVMQMFKAVGFGDWDMMTGLTSTKLYNGSSHTNYLYVKVSEEVGLELDHLKIRTKYFGEHYNESIYFRMLLNMTDNNWQHDYVEGFFVIDKDKDFFNREITDSGDAKGTYIGIPMHMLKKGGTISGGQKVNPIAKSGWNFGRTYLNREVYSLGGDSYNDSFSSIVNDLVSSIGSMGELIKGPNHRLQTKGCAKYFKEGKGWVRLLQPDQKKLGGGSRVAKIKLYDNWDVMTGNNAIAQHYGQEYYYNATGKEIDTETTSGVATFEPNSSKENPLVMPLHGEHAGTYAEMFSGVREDNYTLKPFGENFFPSPTVTYGKVMVKNLKREASGKTLKKSATGKVVHTFYTSKDFPTKSTMTPLTKYNDKPKNKLLNAIAAMLFANVRNHLTMSQGFSIVTNDMNGKQWKQEVFAEGQKAPISSVEYFYETSGKELKNKVVTIDKDGTVGKKQLAVNYDVVHDFKENYSKSQTFGIDANLGAFLVAIFPGMVALPLPTYSRHENILRTAVTTKVVHKMGILKKKVAYDLGARVSTENLAYDANTGQVLLTKTEDEYNDAYYNFTYPVHWAEAYRGMDKASINLGMEGTLVSDGLGSTTGPSYFSFPGGVVKDLFHEGDELLINGEKCWVVKFNATKTGFLLMRIDGSYLNCSKEDLSVNFKIVRSGFRNQQTGSMASVTSMLNPIDIDGNDILNNITSDTYKFLSGASVNPRIVNASAVEYNSYWPSKLETSFFKTYPSGKGFNPFVHNIKGDWRAVKSYAYLTGRKAGTTESSPRREGYFTSFLPFYHLESGVWKIDPEAVNESNQYKWTYASEITQFSPYGLELENKDALNRYSAAQYGYNYTLPIAVASNSEYREMGFDGFEDRDVSIAGDLHFIFGNQYLLPESRINNLGVYISDEQAHTGRKSIAVKTGEFAALKRFLDDGAPVVPLVCQDDVIDTGSGAVCVRGASFHSSGGVLTITVDWSGGSGTLNGTSGDSISFQLGRWGDPVYPSTQQIQTVTIQMIPTGGSLVTATVTVDTGGLGVTNITGGC
ncbi:MAG: hypothetical protein COA88_12620 [Kordia sp.]|nr:MAG: hypothetical protein COA88_12620 [Kordia sp.]